MIQKLLVDTDVRTMCGSWIFEYTAPARFIQLLYGIGFWGIRKKNQDIQYRSVGTQASATPAIEQTTSVVIHPAYHHAIDLPNRIISDLNTDLALREEGLILDIPDSIKLRDYYEVVDGLLKELDSIPLGHEGESRYEDLVGRMIELCFFRSLTNVEPQSRDVEGRIRRDWIASNRANDGFWERVRAKHLSTQVVWECKNFADLDPTAFHQMGYYLNDTIGRFGLVCFRGEEVSNTYYGHLKRFADKDGKYVALITERDVKVFLPQAKHGKVKESHIQEIYDRTIRKIS